MAQLETHTPSTSETPLTPGSQVEVETPQQPVRKKIRRRRLPSW